MGRACHPLPAAGSRPSSGAGRMRGGSAIRTDNCALWKHALAAFRLSAFRRRLHRLHDVHDRLGAGQRQQGRFSGFVLGGHRIGDAGEDLIIDMLDETGFAVHDGGRVADRAAEHLGERLQAEAHTEHGLAELGA